MKDADARREHEVGLERTEVQHEFRQKPPRFEPLFRYAEHEMICFQTAVVCFGIEIPHKETADFPQKPVAFFHAEQVVIRFEPVQIEARQNKTRIRICVQNAACGVKEFYAVIYS